MADARWQNVNQLTSQAYVCGYCSSSVASSQGYFAGNAIEGLPSNILICPHCSKPTFFHGATPTPGVAPGKPVQHVPKEAHDLYDEARRCMSVSAYTASVLACRKLLMNLAVSVGAAENLPFAAYVQFLADHHYVPPNGKVWVDHIRKKGNEATHEIALMSESDATDLVIFAEMLLKFMFEFPSRVPAAPPAP